ncbi:MAG: ABC transporter substrate-binding protein [Polaromonas sp.]
MKHILKTLLVGATISLTLAGQAWAQKKVIIGNFGEPLPYEAAIAEGKFDKATGWNIEWRKFGSGAEVNAAMASGAMVIAELGSVPLAAGASQGVDYQMFLVAKVIGSSESLLIRNGAGIDKPADLKGKAIAVPVGSTAHFSLMGALKNWGIPEKDVKIVGMSPPEIGAAWSQKNIDAAFIWEPVKSKLLADGKLMTTAGAVGKAGYPTFNGWVVDRKFAAENRQGLIAFAKVMNEVNASYNRDKTAWNAESPQVKSIASRIGMTPADVVLALDGASYPDGSEQVSKELLAEGSATSLKSTADFLKANGRISTAAASYTKFVNPDIARAALAK